MWNLQIWIGIGVVGGAIISIITLATLVGKPLRRLSRQNDEFREDWYGEPARPGRDAIPGVPERLSRIETELSASGSVRESIVRIETRLDEHIRSHPDPKSEDRPGIH